MPKGRAIKSARQFRLMQAAAHGKLRGPGPSPEVARKLLAETSHKKKSQFARMRKNA